jgi:hypothetical protein
MATCGGIFIVFVAILFERSVIFKQRPDDFSLEIRNLIIKLWGQATGWTLRVRFLTGARDFSLLNSVQIDSEAQPASYPIGT